MVTPLPYDYIYIDIFKPFQFQKLLSGKKIVYYYKK